MEFSVHHLVLLLVFLVAIVLGAFMHKTRFCTMGGVSDWVNMDHKGRLGAWFFAIAIATGGLLILEAAQVVSVQNKTLGASFPPYRTAQFAWLRYLLGGLVFGIGMTLAGGCGSRTIVRVGGGSLKSLVVLIVAGVATYFMMWTDFYQKVFAVWIAPTTINLARWGIPSQELGSVVGGFTGLQHAQALHFIIGGVLVAL
ncbi:MAG TPA: YeeE/YedE thiosulfate transporter family protein, partial [Burkholderiaceae bacterium]|nr:YeeE/YedE thiosulfate transporter family protein [Burkholderiaceae bacterium]